VETYIDTIYLLEHTPVSNLLKALRLLKAHLVCEHAGGREGKEKMNLSAEEGKDDEDQ